MEHLRSLLLCMHCHHIPGNETCCQCPTRKLTSGTSPGMRLRRAYRPPPEGAAVQEADPKAEEVDQAAATVPISKLLLVVHGIGQNLSGSNIAGLFNLPLHFCPRVL